MRSPLTTESATTWYVKMSARLGRAKMPVASVPKVVAKAVMAASVGANNVNGPGPESVPARSASSTASSSRV